MPETLENKGFPARSSERLTGIEPASQPWEGRILPMYYNRTTGVLYLFRTELSRCFSHKVNQPMDRLTIVNYLNFNHYHDFISFLQL